MDAQRWRAEQREIRRLLRSKRRSGPPYPHAVSGMGGEPLASVIVVCWNAAEVLGRCLDQLLAQDYGNYEVVVVDDGSQDGTLDVAEAAASASGGAVTVVRSPANRGCPHARNLGLSRAKGELVAFIDADGFAAPDWLRQVVAPFEADASIGGVASTVFFDASPLVINGAGGIVNRQGWAADLSMNESYEWAEIASEALYPMGCGMAVRRSAVERVGPFDDHMLNYYDDVDYGVRLWRAGYRVVVAQEAWVDHGFGQAGGDSSAKQLLCERHRMRVVLKHATLRTLRSWATHEARELRDADAPRRALKLKAFAWNARHLRSVVGTRRRLRGCVRAPERLGDQSWGDDFPAGVPPILLPSPEQAGSAIDVADSRSERQLVHGWFPAEHVEGRSYRWAGAHAATLIRLDRPARRLRLDYAHVPVDTGGVHLQVRRLSSEDPLSAVWATLLPWQYIARSVENRLLALSAGDYEVVFSVAHGWLEPPLKTRLLGFALSAMSFEESYDLVSAGLDMASPAVQDQLLSGWYEPEYGAGRSYRWATRNASVIVRLTDARGTATLNYRFPPGSTGGVSISARHVDSAERLWSMRLPWQAGDWAQQTLSLSLAPGDYVLSFESDTTWSNPGQRDPRMPPENRTLGFAVSSLLVGEDAQRR
jgi:GT2 family glycosyltransferase